MKLEYYKNLDGLRGIAAIMVVAFHFYSYPDGYYDDATLAKKITGIGQHGVSLFFVLSGFLITRILFATKGSGNYFYCFFVKRILRIAPLYYFFLFIWFYLLPPLINYPIAPVMDQLPAFLYVQNVYSTFGIPQGGPPHFWSLAVEEHFYLVWPFVVYYTPSRHLIKLLIAGTAAIFVIRYFMLSNGLPIHDFTLTRIDQIMMGTFLAILELKGLFRKQSVFGLALVSILSVASATYFFMLGPEFFLLKEMLKYFLLAICFASIIGMFLSLSTNSFVNKVLSTRPLLYVGQISYGIYVWHVVALILLQHFLITGIVLVDLLVAFGLTFVMAHVSFYYFELYFLRWKLHLTNAPQTGSWDKMVAAVKGVFM